MATKQNDRLIPQLVENQLGVICYWLWVNCLDTMKQILTYTVLSPSLNSFGIEQVCGREDVVIFSYRVITL
jgi:hypothetical protein